MTDNDSRSVPAQLGYLTHAVESLCTDVKKIGEDSERYDKKLSTRLTKIEDQISLYKTVIKTLKAVSLTVLFIVAFKFGDISSLWK